MNAGSLATLDGGTLALVPRLTTSDCDWDCEMDGESPPSSPRSGHHLRSNEGTPKAIDVDFRSASCRHGLSGVLTQFPYAKAGELHFGNGALLSSTRRLIAMGSART